MMREMQSAVQILCGITMLRAALTLLLPKGTVRSYAEFGFSLVQSALMLTWLERFLSELAGVLP